MGAPPLAPGLLVTYPLNVGLGLQLRTCPLGLLKYEAYGMRWIVKTPLEQSHSTYNIGWLTR